MNSFSAAVLCSKVVIFRSVEFIASTGDKYHSLNLRGRERGYPNDFVTGEQARGPAVRAVVHEQEFPLWWRQKVSREGIISGMDFSSLYNGPIPVSCGFFVIGIVILASGYGIGVRLLWDFTIEPK
jgi:hypothetical protein